MLDLLLGRLLVVALIAVALRMARECHAVWCGWRAGRRSLPMALAFTSVAIQMPILLVGVPLLQRHRPQWLAGPVESFFATLFIVTALLGAAGLILDRRIKEKAPPPNGDTEPDPPLPDADSGHADPPDDVVKLRLPPEREA